MGELIYIVAETKKIMFSQTDLIRSDIFFAKEDQYTILCLKQSKINIVHIGVKITLAAIKKCKCVVAAPRQLFIQDQRSANAFLFRLQFAIFTR